MHSTLFNFSYDGDIPPSRSAFPLAFPESNWQFSVPYFFNGSPLNWVSSSVITYVIGLSKETDEARTESEQYFSQLQNLVDNKLVQEAIAVAENGYLIIWLAGENLSEEVFQATKVNSITAQSLIVKKAWTRPDPGISAMPNQSYNVVLEQS